MSVDDEERSRRTSIGTTTENVEELREAIPEVRRRTIDDVYDIVKLSYGTCQQMLHHELNMRRTAAKFVSRLTSNDQKERRVALSLRNRPKSTPNFASSIITGDGSLVYGFDPETKQQSSQWETSNSPRPKKARQIRNNVRSMLICFT